MSDYLKELLEKARAVEPTEDQDEQQRISFVYGNLKLEDEKVTREEIARASEEHRRKGVSDGPAQRTPR